MKLEIEGKFVHNSRRRDSRSAEEVRLAEERFDSIDFDLEQDIMTQVNESRIKKKKNVQRYPYSIVIDFYPRALSKLGAMAKPEMAVVQWCEK